MPRKVRHIQDLRRLAVFALQNGATLTRANVLTWDASAGCENPFPLSLEGRSPVLGARDAWGKYSFSDATHPGAQPCVSNEYGYMRILWIDIDAPCRKCRTCLKRRQVHWAYRAKAELAAAPRTWFGTLTADPDWQVKFQYRAALAADARGVELMSGSSDEMFRAVTVEMGREVTKWLKRVRKNTGARLRYLLVAEAHKTGLPHMHILVHEMTESSVKWRDLHDTWECGFSLFKLVDDKRYANYVCKYLGKTALSRVRASQFYGKSST